LNISRPRSAASIVFHGPDSRACRAALTTRSTSSGPASWTWQRVAPVAGSMAGNVFPDEPGTNLPAMNSGWSFTAGRFAAGWGRVVADMVSPDPGGHKRDGRRDTLRTMGSSG